MLRPLKDPGKEHSAAAPLRDGEGGEEVTVGAVRFQGRHDPRGARVAAKAHVNTTFSSASPLL